MFSLFFELVQFRYVNWADEFHTLRCRVVRHVYMIFLRTWLEKMYDLCAFVLHCCVKQRNFGFDKSSELSMENVHNE